MGGHPGLRVGRLGAPLRKKQVPLIQCNPCAVQVCSNGTFFSLVGRCGDHTQFCLVWVSPEGFWNISLVTEARQHPAGHNLCRAANRVPRRGFEEIFNCKEPNWSKLVWGCVWHGHLFTRQRVGFTHEVPWTPAFE